MLTVLCPFHEECQFYNCPARTPSSDVLMQLFCRGRYDGCMIAKSTSCQRADSDSLRIIALPPSALCRAVATEACLRSLGVNNE